MEINGIYQLCKDLMATYVFGGVTVGSYEELVSILFSTCACLFVVAIPFIVVYLVIKVIINAFNKLWG